VLEKNDDKTTNRAIFSLIENFQQADGSIVLPKVLSDFMGKKVI
jgi:seryl-tRNA synthetase